MKKIVIEKDLNDEFANKIHESKVMQLPSYGLWPNKEVKKYPIDQSEQNPLDQIADINKNNADEFLEILSKMKRSGRLKS